MSTIPPVSIRHRRYLRDRDVLQAGLVSLLVLLLSGGVVWLGYLIHVCRVAARSPRVPPRRMVALVFGRQLRHDQPVHDYGQRLQRALALARAKHTDHLLLLGGGRPGQRSEAAAGEVWLRQRGLPDRVRLELEQASSDSLENLRHARQLLQAQAGHAALPSVALGGNWWPDTREKFTPACSNTAPPRSTRVRPPPPAARVHASSWKRAAPSACSTAWQMRSCSSRRKISAWSACALIVSSLGCRRPA